ncbi:hypothetical protein [Aeromonas sp.]|uniref:hypothetical protein n=1 Tax=Aeromonas sp. TaxID=647 RepID=UPI002582C1A7|nr:hypothetical protein [Aeromonas sp.]MCX7132231.1 hypothetical protein [Aeromonas sp.]
MTTALIIAGLVVSLFLFRRDCNVAATAIKTIVTLVIFSPMLSAVNFAKLIVSSVTHSVVGWAMIPLAIYILLYIICPKSER